MLFFFAIRFGMEAAAADARSTLVGMPDECLWHVLYYVDVELRALASMQACCQRLDALGRDNLLWRAIFEREVGAPPGTDPEALRPLVWRSESWRESMRRVVRITVVVGIDAAFDCVESCVDGHVRVKVIVGAVGMIRLRGRTLSKVAFEALGRALKRPSRAQVWLAVPHSDIAPTHDRWHQYTWTPLCIVFDGNRSARRSSHALMPWFWWHVLATAARSDSASDLTLCLICTTFGVSVTGRDTPMPVMPPCVAIMLAEPRSTAPPPLDTNGTGIVPTHPWYTRAGTRIQLPHLPDCRCPKT